MVPNLHKFLDCLLLQTDIIFTVEGKQDHHLWLRPGDGLCAWTCSPRCSSGFSPLHDKTLSYISTFQRNMLRPLALTGFRALTLALELLPDSYNSEDLVKRSEMKACSSRRPRWGSGLGVRIAAPSQNLYVPGLCCSFSGGDMLGASALAV